MIRSTRLGWRPWLGFALGLVAACFQAPQPAVQFSCDPDDAPECPEGYTCESDGCCHLDGSDVDEHAGECQLGAAAPTGGSGFPATEGTSGEGSTTPGTTATAGSDTAGSTAGTAATEGGTTAGSTDAGSDTRGATGTG